MKRSEKSVISSPEQVLAAWTALSTSTVSDALDRLGIAGQVCGLAPLHQSYRLTGRAFTGRYEPVDVNGGTVGDYIDDVPAGAVIVLDNSGRTDATVWGDILTLTAQSRGVAGTVIDGVCRDTRDSLEAGYPLFTRGTWMRTGKDRVQMVAAQVPVSVGGVRVRPGDLVLGDADGIVIVPAEREAAVLGVANSIEACEEQIRHRVNAGSSLASARAEAGYFTLQSRSTD
jgi:4-hydroxy-4-methyl-2-oxoglutarate aldolase